jgi:2,3-bisphosphoglycerate-independent phosphoglycerate mutase
MPPGSDVANLAVLGYDPAAVFSGRSPLEAASIGVELGPDDVSYRLNLVTVAGGLMKDNTAGHKQRRRPPLHRSAAGRLAPRLRVPRG